MIRRRTWIAAAAILALAGIAAAVYWATRGGEANLSASDGPVVPTARVTFGPLELSVRATGDLRASKSSMLMAPSVGGTLRILQMLPTGTPVKTGDVVVEIDPTEQTFALEQAKSELEQAQQEIAKMKADAAVQTAQDKVALLTAKFDVRRAELDRVADPDLIAANESAKRQLAYEEAQRRLAQIEQDSQSRAEASRAGLTLLDERRAKAELSMTRAQQSIDSLVLKAPIDGHVVVRENRDASGGFFYSGMTLPEYRAGDNTFAGRSLADVFDLSALEIRIKVGEQDRPNVSVDQRATVESDGLPGRSFPGHVSQIAGMAQSDWWATSGPMRQFDAVLALDNVTPDLRPGSSVRVVLAGRRLDNILQIPIQAVRQKDGKPVVFVQTAGGFEPRPIKVTARTESRVGIEGVDQGTVVALVDPEAAARASSGASAGAIK